MANAYDVYKVVEIKGRQWTVLYDGTVIDDEGGIANKIWTRRAKSKSSWRSNLLDTDETQTSEEEEDEESSVGLTVNDEQSDLTWGDALEGIWGAIKDTWTKELFPKKVRDAKPGWYAAKAGIYFLNEKGVWSWLNPDTGKLEHTGMNDALTRSAERSDRLTPTQPGTSEFEEAFARSGYVETAGVFSKLFANYGSIKGVENFIQFGMNAFANLIEDPVKALFNGDWERVLTLESKYDLDLIGAYGQSLADEMAASGNPDLVWMSAFPTEILLDLFVPGGIGTKLITNGKLTKLGLNAQKAVDLAGGADRVDWVLFERDPVGYITRLEAAKRGEKLTTKDLVKIQTGEVNVLRRLSDRVGYTTPVFINGRRINNLTRNKKGQFTKVPFILEVKPLKRVLREIDAARLGTVETKPLKRKVLSEETAGLKVSIDSLNQLERRSAIAKAAIKIDKNIRQIYRNITFNRRYLAGKLDASNFNRLTRSSKLAIKAALKVDRLKKLVRRTVSSEAAITLPADLFRILISPVWAVGQATIRIAGGKTRKLIRKRALAGRRLKIRRDQLRNLTRQDQKHLFKAQRKIAADELRQLRREARSTLTKAARVYLRFEDLTQKYRKTTASVKAVINLPETVIRILRKTASGTVRVARIITPGRLKKLSRLAVVKPEEPVKPAVTTDVPVATPATSNPSLYALPSGGQRGPAVGAHNISGEVLKGRDSLIKVRSK